MVKNGCHSGTVQNTQFLLLGDNSDSVEWFRFVTMRGYTITLLQVQGDRSVHFAFSFSIEIEYIALQLSQELTHLFAQNVALDSEQQFTHFA